jgi:hypothetical protein
MAIASAIQDMRFAGRGRQAAAALALILVAACTTAPPPVVTPEANPPPVAETPTDPDPPTALASRPPEPQATPQTAPIDAARLIGVTGDVLRDWLGETVFVRRDGSAEIWRFAADSCFLDVFLYRDPTAALRIAHVDARPKTGAQRVTAQTCYGRILAEHPAKPEG